MTAEASGQFAFAASVHRERGRNQLASGGVDPPARDPTQSAVLASFAAVLVHVLSGRGDLVLVTTPFEKTVYLATRNFFPRSSNGGVTNREMLVLVKVASRRQAAQS